jgi:crossover junction endodeoxyribonuclease RuvC
MNETRSVYVGVDPGASGAIAVLWPADGGRIWDVEFHDMNGSVLDMIEFLRSVKARAEGRDIVAAIENVNSFGMGRQSAFKFGASWGSVRTAVLGAGFKLAAEPTAGQWKRTIFGSTLKGLDKKALKTASRDKARQLYPQAADDLARVKDADRAEALLIAEYAIQRRRYA